MTVHLPFVCVGYVHVHVCVWVHEQSVNHISLKTVGLYVTQSHSLCWTCFGQCQALSAALEWQEDGDGYLMHRMQSSGWPCPYPRQKLLKFSSFCAAVHAHAQSLCWSALVTKTFVHSTIVSSPDPTYERGSGDIRLIPRASLMLITFWREISLRQSHCRKDNL